jgi:hypothetical protein
LGRTADGQQSLDLPLKILGNHNTRNKSKRY